jgi:putative tricarboxylic transport membrane protein
MGNLVEVFAISNILYCALGVFVGITFGCMPGLTATMGIVLFLPFTFGMDPVASFALLLGIYVGGVYGGSITAILIKTPGTASSAATVLDGYPLAVKGEGSEALSMSTIASFVGGVISCVALMLLAPQLARVALKFGPAEYFAVGMFGISIVASISSTNLIKGLLSALFGLLIITVGMDPLEGSLRFTFGNYNLSAGINATPALIGMFAIAEVLEKIETTYKGKIKGTVTVIQGKMVGWKVIKANIVNLIRSSLIGTGIGIIPATGTGVASWLSYNEAKRASKEPELFGNGSYEGIVASEAANNAVTGGALIPLLTLGIPGDIITAVMMGALIIQGITPGPKLFIDQMDIVTGIYLMLLLANVFMLIFGLSGVRLFIKVLKVPVEYLMPIVAVLCFVGAFAVQNSLFDLKVVLGMGVIGYLFNKAEMPIPPMLLGILLGKILEANLRRALVISHGDWTIFLTRPICLGLLIVSVLSFLWPILRARKEFIFNVYKDDEE